MDRTTNFWFSKHKTACLFFALGIFFSSLAKAQTTSQTSPSGTFYTYTVPAGVTQIMIETWGGGGRGGTTTGTNKGGGGGGGGYARRVLDVTPGATYYYNVGAGATLTTASGSSWFGTSSNGSSPIASATGGGNGSNNSATSAGGSAGTGTSTGGQVFSGGAGGAASSTRSGNGGSSGGVDAAGSAGGNAATVTTPVGAGTGGLGRANAGAGSGGVSPGGGGGGGFNAGNGGLGANGKVVISPVVAGWGSGSRDFFPSNALGGARTSLISHTNSLYVAAQPFMNRGIHKVYAKNGEKIYLGNSAQGYGTAPGGTIRVYRPSTLPNASRSNYDFNSGSAATVGRIQNRREELLGPIIPSSANTEGYTPYVIDVDETGVWEIEFLAPGSSQGAIPTGIPSGYSTGDANAQTWTQATGADEAIIAWDVTVADGTTIKSGRTYLNVFNGGHDFDWTGSFYGKFWALTKDGFPYLIENNGMTGGFFTFFVNNRGFTTLDNGLGDRTYKSYSYTVNGTTGVHTPTPKVKNPNLPDDADELNITHKLFYGQPSADLPASATYNGGTTWLKLARPTNPKATGITVEGVEGSLDFASSKGAYIKFEANVAGTYRITIPGNGTTYFDRVLAGPTVFGQNSVKWDGKQGVNGDPLTAGNPFPAGVGVGSVTVQLKGAEVHFPFFDMEANNNGIKIIQLDTVTYALPADGTKDEVYWNDSDISVLANQIKSNPTTVALGSVGVHSSGSSQNGHKYGSSNNAEAGAFGNNRAIDTYSFVPGPTVTEPVTLVIYEADLEVTSLTSPKSGAVNIGDSWTYTAQVKNSGPTAIISNSNAGNGNIIQPAKFQLYVPGGISLDPLAVTFNSSNGVAIVGTPTFANGIYTAQLDMPVNGTATFTLPISVSAAVSQTGNGDINVYATMLRPNDFSDPDATNTQSIAPTDPFFEATGINTAFSTAIFTNPAGVVLTSTNNIKRHSIPNMKADLKIVKTGKQSSTGNGVGSFTITVENLGTSIATGVVVTDVLSSRYTYTGSSATLGSVDYTGKTITWTIGTIPVNGSETLTFNTTNVGTTNKANTATVVSELFDPVTSNNTSTVSFAGGDDVASPTTDLQIVKLVNGSPTASVLVGAVVTFTITVNRVSGSDVTNVLAKDLVPVGFTITGTPVASQGTFNTSTGVWNIGSINSSANRTLTITAVVNPTTGTAGEYTNVSSITSTSNLDDVPGNNVSQASITVSSLLITNPMIYQRTKN